MRITICGSVKFAEKNVPYVDEIKAMVDEVIDGDLNKIK